MRAVIAGVGSPYKADVLRRLELTKDVVRKALPRLTATAEIEAEDGKHVVVDPIFASWIERINEGLDAELGEQVLTVGPDFPYWEDPSLWSVLELVK